MKNILLAILILYLVVGCSSQADAPSGCGCGCGCGSDPNLPAPCPSPSQGSFNVNQQVVIDTPETIAPPCPTPNIPVPVVNPPPVVIPTINVPQVQVCALPIPQVVAPPTVTPPRPVIPQFNLPNIPIPQLPPQVPLPTTIPTRPTAPIVVLPLPPVGPGCQPLSKIFTLSFQWACRRTVAFQSCEANILWNNVIVASIVPVDYTIRLFKVNVTAVAGQNSLQIEGAGVGDTTGLSIDNVQLIRVGSAQNIVVNGDFQLPPQMGGFKIYNSIPGWSGLGMKLGWGDLFNVDWNSQVCQLDGNRNFQISQYFNFDSSFQLVGSNINPFQYGQSQFLTYQLSFSYSAKSIGASSPLTSQANVLWNNVVVGSLVPRDYKIYRFSANVRLIAGANILAFDGAGVSDGSGLIIDNVRLISAYNSTNLISNGDFTNVGPVIPGQMIFDNGIPSWFAQRAEVANCRQFFNNLWPVSSGNCIELDSNSNQRYMQTITISQQLFTSLLVFIQTQIGVTTVQSNLANAVMQANDRLNSAVARIQDDIVCQVNFLNRDFSQYLAALYSCVKCGARDLRPDQELVLSQYDYLLDAWTSRFGKSNLIDFDDKYFVGRALRTWSGHIKQINGQVITCHDAQGLRHLIQIAPCTQFNGQFLLPSIGQRIFWRGVPDASGRTFVKLATTCNC